MSKRTISQSMTTMQNAIDFSHQVTLPDAGDRTANDPVYLMNSFDLLKLVRQHAKYYGHEAADNLTKADINNETVKTIVDAALASGWLKVELVGKQLMFTSPAIGLAR